MKWIIVVTIIVVFFQGNLFSQPKSIWVRNHSDYYAGCVVETYDGGYIVGGQSDGIVTKWSSSGQLLWDKKLCYGSYSFIYSIAECSDKGLIMGGDDCFIKTDSLGQIEWVKNFGVVNSAKETIDKGFIIASEGDGNFYIVRLDSAGNTLWQKSYGGSKEDIPYSIEQTTDKGFIVAGTTKSKNGDVVGNNCYYDSINSGWILKLDSTGKILWQRCTPNELTDVSEAAYSVTQSDDGGYIVVGGYYLKLDSNGEIVWKKNLDNERELLSVSKTYDNTFIAGGYWLIMETAPGEIWYTYQYLITKFDNNGNFQWGITSCYGRVHQVIQTTDKGYIVVGDDVGKCEIGKGYIQKLTPYNEITFNKENAYCSECNGKVSVTSVGTPPFTYHWENGATTQILENLCFGKYKITVTDSAGISGNSEVQILNITFKDTIMIRQPSCFGEKGSIMTVPKNGFPPYTYLWNTLDTMATISNLDSGIYKIKLTDSTGCSIEDSVVIFEAPSTALTIRDSSIMAACSSCNGSAYLFVAGGVPPYKYKWSNNDTVSFLPKLSAGTHYVTVTDSKGCYVIDTIVINFTNSNLNIQKDIIDKFQILPNPCTTCEILGVTDSKDIIVTDLLGKALNVSFINTPEGFNIKMPNTSFGIYFLRNIKTGEVRRFVREY